MAKEELKEFKADGENSEIADPIATGPNDRKADLKKKANPTADSVVDLIGINKGASLLDSAKNMGQAPARLADKRVKESVEELFDGSELSEEFKEKAATIFEGIVIEKVAEEKTALEEEYKTAFEAVKTALEEKVDAYLNYIAEEFLEENEIAIETASKVAVAEQFMDGLKSLFVENNVVLPEEGLDIVENLEAKIAELEKNLNESEAKNVELTKSLTESEKTKSVAEVVSEISEGLTDTQKDRLNTFAEGVQYETIEEFREKLNVLKETFVAKKTAKGEEELNEEFVPAETVTTPVIDAVMASYLSATSRTLKK